MNTPEDKVLPKQRVAPVAVEASDQGGQGGDRYADQIGSAVKLLGAPKPELLWILLLVVVIEGSQLWEADRRVSATKTLMEKVMVHIEGTESHRSEEQRRAQETIRVLSQSLTRQVEKGVAEVFTGRLEKDK